MKLVSFFILILIITSCFKQRKKESVKVNEKSVLLTDATYNIIESSFRKRGINGCFVLYDVEKDASIIYNKTRSVQPFLHASTFKILNSLIALESGVIKDENEIIHWDGIERTVSVWNKDHNMQTGIKNSVVWFYQELARRIGEEQMQMWVDTTGYGNQNIQNNIDDFWLVGKLRITPMEQLEFLKRFNIGDFPFNQSNISTVQKILIEDQNERYVLRGKTGWADVDQAIGWYIGYFTFENKTFIFVNNIDINSAEDAQARKAIVKEVIMAVFNVELAL